MYHPKMVEWDNRMKAMFDRIDSVLEDRYGGRWKLRRNRPGRGKTANPDASGLFNVGTFFDPGYGTELGRGYLVEIIIATEEEVPEEIEEEIRQFVKELLERMLPQFFPERRLSVGREGTMYKIYGDLRLGEI